jgi:hypothetical protein
MGYRVTALQDAVELAVLLQGVLRGAGGQWAEASPQVRLRECEIVHVS